MAAANIHACPQYSGHACEWFPLVNSGSPPNSPVSRSYYLVSQAVRPRLLEASSPATPSPTALSSRGDGNRLGFPCVCFVSVQEVRVAEVK